MMKCIAMLGAGLCLTAALAGAQSCPVDTLLISNPSDPGGPGLVQVSTEPVEMLAGSNPDVFTSYNLSARHATATARLYAPYNSFVRVASGRVAARDVFTLSGPATATPVSFHARLRVQKRSSGYQSYDCYGQTCAVPSGAVFAAFSAGDQSAPSWSRMQDGVDSTELVIPLAVVSGQSFEVAVVLSVNADFAGNPSLDQGSNRVAELTGDWDFPDLPSGWSLVSCQGAQAWANVPICANAGTYTVPVIASDGQGGAYVAWGDTRGPQPKIYAQHVSERGEPLWRTNGILLGSGGGDQWKPVIVPDGEGGAIISWFDFGVPATGAICAQRVNAQGDLMWPAQGLVMALIGPIQYEPTARLISDGQGGAITTWMDRRSGIERAYAQRVANSGVIRWGASGMSVCEVAGQQWVPDLVADGAGGAVICWTETRLTTATHLYAQRLDASGGRLWPSGAVDVGELVVRPRGHMIVPDGSGGAYFGWGGADRLARLAHVAANGSLPWGAQPLQPGTGEVETLVENGMHGFLMACMGSNGQPESVRRVDPSGALSWSAPVMDATYWNASCSDGAGGLFMAFQSSGWQSREPGVSHVTSEGVRRWRLQGLMLNNFPSDPDYYYVTPGMPGEALIAWQEGADVRASRMPLVPAITTGPVPTLVEVFRLEDSAEGVIVHWSGAEGAFSTPLAAQRAASEHGEWSAIGGDVRCDGGVWTQLDREATTGAPSWYRLTGMLADGSTFIAPALNIVHEGAAGEVVLEPLAPNPARRSALVTYALPRPGRVSLTLHDVQGREVMRYAVPLAEAGRHVATLDVSDMHAGLYFVKLRAGGAERIRRIVVVR